MEQLESYSKSIRLLSIALLLFFPNIIVRGQEEQQQQQPAQQIPLVRLPSNTLLKYTAYKDVSILHFRIPTDTRTALFSFKAYEESKSAFQRECEPRDVTLHLKAGSYPVISPENLEFPKHFLNADQRFEIYNLQFQSDGTTKRLNIDGPHPGNWFAVAFISWTDPNNDRIEQQGLAASCETLLLSEMSVINIIPIIINENLLYTNELLTNQTEPISYKFFVPRNVEIVEWTIEFLTECVNCTELINISVQANGLPNLNNFIENKEIYANQTGNYTLIFYPQNNAWHYIDINFTHFKLDEINPNINNNNNNNVSDSKNLTNINNINSTRNTKDTNNNETLIINKIDFNVQFKFRTIDDQIDEIITTAPSSSSETDTNTTSTTTTTNENDNQSLPFRNITYYQLLRQTYREFFMFDYDLLPDVNGTVPAYLNLTAGQPAGFKFDVGDVYDIGGTLTFGIVMKDTLRDLQFLNDNENNNDHQASSDKKSKIIDTQIIHKDGNSNNNNNKNDAITGGSNQTIIICMRLYEPGVPIWPDKCQYGNQLLPATNILNNTNEDTSTAIINVPFPESGKWFITMTLFCHENDGAETQSSSSSTSSSSSSSSSISTSPSVTIIDSVKEFVRKNINIIDDMKLPCACSINNNIVSSSRMSTKFNETVTDATTIATDYKKCINDKQCLETLTDSEILKIKECLMDSKCTGKYNEMIKEFNRHHKYVTEQKQIMPPIDLIKLNNVSDLSSPAAQSLQSSSSSSASTGTCNTSVIFTISSNPCVNGRCGRYGRCYHYMSGGFVFSTCLCIKGYRGWDCSEDSQVPSSFSILLALLLLTLSNLLFIPSIYFAMLRKYYTEGVIYFFAMFFSIFYHACDSGEDEYSFCLVKIGVLQFCDFYCGLLAIWVTLIAMAHIRQTFVSLLHMFGAILLAFGTELNKQSLWVFLAPALTGLCIISVSWGWRCRHTRKWFPARKYLAVFMPIGMCLVMVGLICYAFLQTRQNYHVVHSIWHMVMALSILCLLPNKKSFLPKC